MEFKDVFHQVRDIPYKLPLQDAEGETCVLKNKRLYNALKEQGFDVRYAVGFYSWNDLPIPDKVKALPHADITLHLYLSVKHEGDWELVDATWDSKLADVLPVNEGSDLGQMQIAVPIIKSVPASKEKETIHILTSPKTDCVQKYPEFNAAFNDWLVSVRNDSMN